MPTAFQQTPTGDTLTERVACVDWNRISESLSEEGAAIIPALLTADECVRMAALYADKGIFRSRVVMARYAFGKGEYQYFSYPLPDLVSELRTSMYRRLAPIANHWNQRMRVSSRYPTEHPEFVALCHAAGQKRPTPLMLTYGDGDYCCMHQDLYGDLFFPLQVVILLSEPEQDFTGGEFLLVEQNPKGPSRAEVVPLKQGDAVIFAVNHRPVKGTRGNFRVNLRHGVSRLHSGNRQTLGIIFHDAK